MSSLVDPAKASSSPTASASMVLTADHPMRFDSGAALGPFPLGLSDLRHLERRRDLELDSDGVHRSLAHGLAVIQGDANTDPQAYADGRSIM
jgi:hypothetical protein